MNTTNLLSSSCLFRLSTHHPGVSQRPAVSSGQSQGMTHRPSGVTKLQFKLLLMEIAAQNMGLSRTQLTPDRLSVALSVMLTKQMLPSQVLKVAPYPASKAEGHECGQEFCRLGCVCSSLQHSNRGPLHCRRPDCMFGCACFKSKITKQMTAQEDEQQIEPLYSMTNMEQVQPRPGSHANKLWNRNIHDVDPEPLFAPKSAPLCLVPLKFQKRGSVPRPTQPLREEDKDPVYKYLESMMTCARVREFNSKPPPELTIEPKIPETSTPNTKAKLQETTTDNLPKKYNRTLLTVKKAAENTSQGTKSNETEARKQIEIQSACQWDKDSKMVLEALCQRMNQNRLSQRFWVGPYHIRPVAKIFMRKPSGAMVTYRVHISKPSKASDNDGDEFDDSGEERHANKNLGQDIEAEEEDGKIEEPEMQFGVTPFLSGVLPAGRLKARTKPVDCRAYGLIQVNGKSYNQARLLLGNMGSLHPANRLAAYVTSRLHAPADISQGNSQKSDPTNKINTPDALHMKAAGTLVPPIITARKTTDLKTPTQQPVQLFQTDSWRKGPITLPQNSQNSTSIHPVQTFVSGQRSSVSSFQNSSTSSPVSLTVSPALKTPSFLGQSGTYSFRICPPANQGTRDQNLPGVTLPGGFTLIQLPKPGAAQQSVRNSVNTTNMAGRDKGLVQKDALYNSGHFTADSDTNWLGVDTLTGAKDLSSSRQVEPGSSPELVCEEKMPSDEIDEANCRRVESNLDITSEDLSSDYSDDCGEGDEDDEVVDIETVEEVRQGLAIAKMKEAASKALRESRDSSEGFGSTRGLEIQDQMEDIHDECKDKRRRKNHTVLERQRRSEQRTLFDKLQTVLQSDPRAPRLRLLSLALKEIQNLVETSRHLEEKKRRLTRMQSVYVKELSLLSGKSDTLIKHKLKEICERQKIKEKTMKWRPFFSQLLQSRAALLQAITPQSKPQPRALLQPDFFMTPSVALPHTTAAQNSLKSPMPTPAVSSEGLVDVTAPSPQAGNLPGEPVASVQVGQRQPKFEGQQEIPGAPAQFSTPNSQTECHPQIPSVAATIHSTVAQDGASAIFSTPNSSNSSAHPPQSFALPLIRSKTGRIILPSSLKPIGQGFYTLMFMKAKQNEEEAECSSSANVQPSDVDSFNNQEKGFTESDHHSDSERRRISEDKTVQSSNSEPNRSGGTAPLAELALLNKSIFVPSVALQAVENSQKEGTVVGLNKTLATAGMAFNHVRQIDASVKLEPDPSAPAVRRRRGRPRKNPITPVSENEKHTLVEDTSESETSILVGERQSEVIKTQAEDTPERVIDNPVPVKRGRGRPPKKKSAQLWSPAIVLAGSSPSKSNEDSPVRLSRHFKSPDAKPKESSAATSLHEHMTTSRPLTRGSLGKDFPSAKKRSWIDIEKELEPELESE